MNNEQSTREMKERSSFDAGPSCHERERPSCNTIASYTHDDGDIQGEVCWARFQDSIIQKRLLCTHGDGDAQGQVCWAIFQDSIHLGGSFERRGVVGMRISSWGQFGKQAHWDLALQHVLP